MRRPAPELLGHRPVPARANRGRVIPTILIGAIAMATVGLGAAIAGRNLTGIKTGLVAESMAARLPLAGGPRLPLPTKVRLPSPSPVAVAPNRSGGSRPGASGKSSFRTRGIFRYTSTDFASMRAVGFNAATDGGVQDHGASEAANGITGMVWVDAYNNSSCAQTMSNSQIAAMVTANVSAGSAGLRYEIGDEPTANGCNAAPAYASMTQAVHSADPSAKTWVADDQFQVGNAVQSGVPMKGSVDILAFDVYPCESGACSYSAIDSAVRQIRAGGVVNWEFIIQDFNSSPWRWPTPAEIQAQFDHWKNAGAMGYWVYAWDYQGQEVSAQSGNLAMLRQINSS